MAVERWVVVETKGLGRLLFERDLDARFGGVGDRVGGLCFCCIHALTLLLDGLL